MNGWLPSELSFRTKILMLLGFTVSLIATIWSGLSLSGSPRFLNHLGSFCAGLCIEGSLIFFWSAIYAYFARKWRWSPMACHLAGVPFVVAGLLLLFFAGTDRMRYFGAFCLAANSALVGYVCRRLAFPHLTDEQAAAPPRPLSLFPK
jgi:hypothetical protein